MRVYAPITADELQKLLLDGSWTPSQLFSASDEFSDKHPDLDEEECEYLLSLEAARLSLESSDFGLVLAAEVNQLGAIAKSEVECVFECLPINDDPEIDLVWYGPSEIESQLPAWRSR